MFEFFLPVYIQSCYRLPKKKNQIDSFGILNVFKHVLKINSDSYFFLIYFTTGGFYCGNDHGEDIYRIHAYPRYTLTERFR